MAKPTLYLLSPFQEKFNYFLSYLGFFLAGNRAWSHVQVLESKFDIPYDSVAILGQLNVK